MYFFLTNHKQKRYPVHIPSVENGTHIPSIGRGPPFTYVLA